MTDKDTAPRGGIPRGIPATGAISMSTIQTEFGGSNPISLSEYRGKAGAPASGAIDMGFFRGKSNIPLFEFYTGDMTAGTCNLYDNGYIGGEAGKITPSTIKNRTISNLHATHAEGFGSVFSVAGTSPLYDDSGSHTVLYVSVDGGSSWGKFDHQESGRYTRAEKFPYWPVGTIVKVKIAGVREWYEVPGKREAVEALAADYLGE